MDALKFAVWTAFVYIISGVIFAVGVQDEHHKSKAWDIYNQCLWDASKFGGISEEDQTKCNQEGHRYLRIIEEKK